MITAFYENLATYCKLNPEFNSVVNSFLGNTENLNFNAWVYNIFNQYVIVTMFLLLVRSWLPLSKRKYINWLVIIYLVVISVSLITQLEPLYLTQPMIFAVGANMILIACGLYFIGLITDSKYLVAKPLRLISFWQVTFLLFTYSLTYITWVSSLYLYEVNPDLGVSLMTIDMIMGIINLFVLFLILISPKFPKFFQKEPYYGI
ncbi:histidine kinase [Algoriphagus sediminis]|uniref:Histidine kinase n=1 Tax=Algoriphagus sediminis TaxID=3057113 RepID=A0ABT7YCP8_9BACT|nr:histidine kinase [Algoriphagus sediminis]MDN3204290.1 histidine kinase [Algoriphagus sediminis]